MPVRVEVVAYAPTVFTHCQQCEVTFREAGLAQRALREQARDSLPPDLLEEFQAVSDWVHEVVHRYGDDVDVRVTDAVSIAGVVKSMVHRTRTYPAYVVDGDTYGDADSATAAIDERIVSSATGGGPTELN